MPLAENFRRQVDLLLRVVPYIAKEKCFALKGGTAINLFFRDLPRLSVDIDLTYVNVLPRARSLGAIDKAMKRIAARIEKGIKGAHVTQTVTEGTVTKLFIQERRVQIKVEVTPVMRGSAYEPELRGVTPAVEEAFGFAEMPVVSFADLYAGKIVAALDRQHPRDFFDVRQLMANEGITNEIRAGFIVYLLSHHRPMAEVLAAPAKDIRQKYDAEFVGMTDDAVTLDELLATRSELVAAIVGDMPEAHRRFLVSFERGEPDWDLLGLKGVNKLPAIQWRQQNLDKISKNKRADLVAQLERVLGLDVTPSQLTLLPEASASKKRRASRVQG
ncbi:Nucleotidyl transferase AbiEii/AbiGii toxin family protein [Hyphomicrobium sp. 1Nfss2.1]|uniref:nucleotidyl transferase AbiEii/AbiGii toxin family protein n=1 Tax=Hyphomicrobium sp. 1Nfss2.1 TaxID=3413936 RepID=UPI003C7A7DC3